MQLPQYEVESVQDLYGIVTAIARNSALVHQIASAYAAPMEQMIMFNDQASANYMSSPRAMFSLDQALRILDVLKQDLEFLKELSDAITKEAHEPRQSPEDVGTPV